MIKVIKLILNANLINKIRFYKDCTIGIVSSEKNFIDFKLTYNSKKILMDRGYDKILRDYNIFSKELANKILNQIIDNVTLSKDEENNSQEEENSCQEEENSLSEKSSIDDEDNRSSEKSSLQEDSVDNINSADSFIPELITHQDSTESSDTSDLEDSSNTFDNSKNLIAN